jgi:hypothetical protein
MMVVAVGAAPVEVLATRRAHDVDVTGVGQGLKRAIHRGQADPFAAGAKDGVKLLRAVEAVDVGKQGGDGGALARVASRGSHAMTSFVGHP